MSLQRIAAVLFREYCLLRGSLSRVIPLFVWVTVDILLWGFITKFLNALVSKGPNFVSIFLGAVLLWDFFIRVMHGVAMTFMEDMWARNFLNLFASPISIHEYLVGLIISGVATSAVGFFFMLFLASAVFRFSFFSYGLALIPVLLVLFLFGIALGIFASGMMLRLGPSAEWFVWPIPAILSPFVGVFYPISVLPAWMRIISHILPPTYVFEGMRAMIMGNAIHTFSLVLGILLALFYKALACFFFFRVYKHALRTGLIARYTAESLS
jgi:ABC-2 type transport system permease protein